MSVSAYLGGRVYSARVASDQIIQLTTGTPYVYGSWATFLTLTTPASMPGGRYIASVSAGVAVYTVDPTEVFPLLNVGLWVDGNQQDDGIDAQVLATVSTLGTLSLSNGFAIQYDLDLSAGSRTLELKWRLQGSVPKVEATCYPVTQPHEYGSQIILRAA